MQFMPISTGTWPLPVTPQTGRHPLPQPEQFAATLARLGTDAGDPGRRLRRRQRGVRRASVVAAALGRARSSRGARRRIQGVDRRRAADHDRDSTTPRRQLRRASAIATCGSTRGEVAERVQRDDWRLLDARAPERFAGQVEPIDPVAGHVPGARNHPFASNLGSDARFRRCRSCGSRFAQSQAGVADDHTIVMCGSGVTACNLLLAMEAAGKRGARLYAGSWSEWIRDPSRPD